ncbi:hypothetical protein J437_LFUL015479 [Ladona fulva]|uniref:Aminopeptidase N n=1 Tax=Ladona fulva TaxID=123851 RepID=A0A8K0P7R3_LADFU|nr:hypothetical protein J437_LFUL015479 [Ladona fulva]
MCFSSPATSHIPINMAPSVIFVLVVCSLTPILIHAARSEDSDGRVKLPSHLYPIHYRVRLMPFIWPGNFTTAGELDLLVDCLHSAHNVTLYAKEIDVLDDSVHIFLQDGENHLGKEIPLDPHEKLEVNSKELIIKTAEELKAGSKYRIQMQFIALLNDHLEGFYRSSYEDAATGETRWIAVTQLAPLDARRSFPCFDGREFKATFEFSLARTLNMTSLSNMPLDRSEPIEGMPGWAWDHYQTTPPMSVSLAAYLVFDFEHLRKADEAEKINAGVPFKVWSRSDHLRKADEAEKINAGVPFKVWSRSDVINQTKYAGAITPPILQYYEKFFNYPYTLPKLDLVAVPELIFTTMENWGLIVFSEHDGELRIDHVEPTWRLSEQFPFNEIQNIFFLDALESSHPVHMEIFDPETVKDKFGSISAIKGASLFRMLNHSLGENTFRGGLTLYYKAYSNACADKDDLWQSLTTQAHMDGSLPSNMTVKEVIDTWILQPGFPVVTVERNYESGLTSFSQERFLLYKGEHTTKTGNSTRWWVPITYTSQDNADFTNTRPSFWLSPNEEQPYSMLQSPGEKWIIVNIQETGYYRVNYDARNWKLLTDQLRSQAGAKEQVIPPSARSQLLDDAFNLARSGLLPYSTALDLCLTLRDDTDYLPWASTYRALSFLDEMLTNSPIYDDFKVRNIFLS